MGESEIAVGCKIGSVWIAVNAEEMRVSGRRVR